MSSQAMHNTSDTTDSNDTHFISAEQPWPGLAAFTESARDFFHGRTKATSDLVRLVSTSHAAVLFGQSGLGKTSLIQAGLFPDLRLEAYLPIYVRLDHAEDAPPLAAQILATLEQVCRSRGVDFPVRQPDDTLWAYFHRQNADFWSDGIELLTPVLVLDQFEELFTIGNQSPERQARAAAFVDDLAGLVENRAPRLIRQQIETDPASGRDYDFARANFRLLLSLREDFLPDLESLMPQLPTLRLNRMRLLPMNGSEALQVVVQGGGQLVDAGVSERIVRFVAADKQGNTNVLEKLAVEPSLLSLICSELNLRRQASDLPQISADLLTGARDEILTNFYTRSLDGLPPKAGEFIEEHLLSESGYRNSFALDDALRQPQINRAVIDTLVSRRLLRLEERSGVLRVELTHDLLTQVARDSRNKRREAATQAEAKQQIELNRKKMRRLSALAGIMVAMVLGMGALSWQMFQAKQATQVALTEAQTQKQLAEKQTAVAEASKNAAVAAQEEASRQTKVAEGERIAAQDAQKRSTEALKQALEAERKATEAGAKARLQQLEAERLAASGQIDLAMLGFSDKYDTWKRIVGGTIANAQVGDQILIARGNNILYEYFSKMGMKTEDTIIVGFDSKTPQAQLISLQGRKPIYSLMELEAVGPALYLLLDDLHNPSRYFCAMANPRDFPILKSFEGTPGFPWEMQCNLMEAIHLAALGRDTDAETYMTRAIELGLLHPSLSSKDAISKSLTDISFYHYLDSRWKAFASGSSKDTQEKKERLPTWKERANLVRNVYLFRKVITNMNGRSKYLSVDSTANGNAFLLPYLKRILLARFDSKEWSEAVNAIQVKDKEDSGLTGILNSLPPNLRSKAMAELQLPVDWDSYSGWYERRLAAQAGPANITKGFLPAFLEMPWVVDTLQEWLTHEPDSNWAHKIEAERLSYAKQSDTTRTEIETHTLAAAKSKGATYRMIINGAYTLYISKKYAESIPLWRRSTQINPHSLDGPLMEVLARIELGEPPNSNMVTALTNINKIANNGKTEDGIKAEITYALEILKLETGVRESATSSLEKATIVSKSCGLDFFTKRNWHQKMLELLDKHRTLLCKP